MVPLLIRVDNSASNASENHAFESSPVRIGRNELNDLVLREPFVSQWHAVIWFDENKTAYVDLGSTNGTTVGGERVQANVPIHVDSQTDLRIGPLRLYFVRASVSDQKLKPQRNSLFDASLSTMVAQAPSESQGHTMAIPQGAATHPESEDEATVAAPLPEGAEGAPPQPSAKDDPRVQEAVKRLQRQHDAYRKAWTQLFESIQREIGQVPPDAKQTVLLGLCESLPGLGREPDVRDMARQLDLSPAAFGEVDAESFIERLTPSSTAQQIQDINPARAMERVGALLEAFGEAYVELRKGYEQFGKDLALKTHEEDSPLRRARSGQEVLSYLLDWSADGTERVNELTRAFAEIAIHQVAMLNGLMEGVRSLLTRLSPHEVAGRNSGNANALSTQGRAPGTGLIDLLLPVRPYSLWNRYVTRHRRYVEEDRFTREVFGRAFARAYYMVTGGHVDEGDGSQPTGTFQHQQ